MAYATVEDLESRWRLLTPSERRVAETLLGDASEILAQEGYGDASPAILSIVVCNMVKRAMRTDGDAFGIDGQTTPSDGWGSSLPAGELFPYRREINWLRGFNIGTVPMADLNGE